MILKRIAASIISGCLIASPLQVYGNDNVFSPIIGVAENSSSLGDVNEDSKIDSKDATEILSEYSSLSTGGSGSFDEKKITCADINFDTNIDSKDASLILGYYSYVSTGGSESIESYLQSYQTPTTTTTNTTQSTTTTTTTTTTIATTTTTSPAYVEYHFRSKKYLEDHFAKHGSEFADDFGYNTAEEYEKGANNVINSPIALHKTEKEDGDFVFYIESTNEFVVLPTDGYIRTYFRPSSGKSYYDRQ